MRVLADALLAWTKPSALSRLRLSRLQEDGVDSATSRTASDDIVITGESNSITLINTSIGSGTVVNVSDPTGNPAGSAVVTARPGSLTLNTGGGTYSVAIGSDVTDVGIAAVSGSGNTVTAADGAHVIIAGDVFGSLTNDTINLGSGSDIVFLRGGGNTVNAGGGNNVIVATQAGGDRFVTSAGGATDTIYGFSLTGGDKLDLSRILAGAGAAKDASNLSSFVDVASVAGPQGSAQPSTLLTVRGATATATITLADTGAITLPDLVNGGSVIV